MTCPAANTPSSAAPARRGSDSGFVLVGVVIFVLALTILGLSLFSLSSYEAQFLGRSTRSTQTLYDAIGGIEWAKMVLAKERRLEAVQVGQPAWSKVPARVDSVVAWQNGNTTGNINYSSGSPVRIRALADDGRGQRRMVERMYEPHLPDLLYRNLIDSYDYVRNTYLFIDTSVSPPDTTIRRTVRDGSIRLNAAPDPYPSWMTDDPGPYPTDAGDGVPLPQVSSFIAQHIGTATEVDNPGGSGKYNLLAGDTFYKTTTSGGATLGDFSSAHATIEFNVSGTCVWLLEKGMSILRPVVVNAVNGTSSDRLIIVAGRPDAGNGWLEGIRLRSGIHSPIVPIVLVSDGQVKISREDITTFDGRVDEISIFARSVWLEGPETVGGGPPYRYQILRHTQAMDTVVEQLINAGLLPNTTGLVSSFTPIQGTWRELDPDNPS